MNNVQSQFIRADKLLNDYASKNNDEFERRFVSLLENVNNFISEAKFEGKAKINELVLGYMLVDYFEDIRRLKTFHNIKDINGLKIVSYISYWFLKRKPIQILKQEKELLYVNERFVLAYILDFLNGNNNEDEKLLINRENKGLITFTESLFYFLKYRFNSANALEMILTSFFAGQIYQEKTIDLSENLGKY